MLDHNGDHGRPDRLEAESSGPHQSGGMRRGADGVAGSITATIEQTVRRPVAHTQAEANSENRVNEGAVKAPAARCNRPSRPTLPGSPSRAGFCARHGGLQRGDASIGGAVELGLAVS